MAELLLIVSADTRLACGTVASRNLILPIVCHVLFFCAVIGQHVLMQSEVAAPPFVEVHGRLQRSAMANVVFNWSQFGRRLCFFFCLTSISTFTGKKPQNFIFIGVENLEDKYLLLLSLAKQFKIVDSYLFSANKIN